GEQRAPSAAHLKAGALAFQKAIQGTILDTPTMNSKLKTYLDVLAEYGDKLPRQIRETMGGILDAWNQSLKKSPDWTQFKTLSADAFIKAAGLDNLSGAKRRAIQTIFAMAGPGFTFPASGPVDFGGSGTGTVGGRVNVYGDIHVHGVDNPATFEDQ